MDQKFCGHCVNLEVYETALAKFRTSGNAGKEENK